MHSSKYCDQLTASDLGYLYSKYGNNISDPSIANAMDDVLDLFCSGSSQIDISFRKQCCFISFSFGLNNVNLYFFPRIVI